MQGDSYEHQSQNQGFSMLPSLSICLVISKTVFKMSVAQFESPYTSVKLSHELLKITFPTGKPKLTLGEVSTFQGF